MVADSHLIVRGQLRDQKIRMAGLRCKRRNEAASPCHGNASFSAVGHKISLLTRVDLPFAGADANRTQMTIIDD